MFEKLKNDGTLIVFPLKDGGRWATNEEYALFIPVEHMHLTEMVMGSGEYEYSKEDNSKGKLVRDSYPEVEQLLIPIDKVSKATVIDNSAEVECKEQKTSTTCVLVECSTRTSKYGKNDMAAFNKELYDMIISIHPDVDIYLGDRLTPLTFIRKGEEYSLKNCVGFLAEVVNWV